VELDEHVIGELDSRRLHSLRNQKTGFVFQFHYLLPELTALENVLIPARKAKRSEELTGRARDLLAEFEIADKANRFPSQLSGGEQQRVAIARALVMSPKYLFADEPTGNLDSASGDRVMRIFQDINANLGTTIIYVTHDPDYAALAKRQIHLIDGAIA
jgi:putative ABC transport system ATP-binding protein/lipoprotein-releasing system ATP-binding protein